MLDQGPIQRDHPIPHALAIHLHPQHTSLAALRILDLDLVYRFAMTIAQVEAPYQAAFDNLNARISCQNPIQLSS
jgi:hypothetical protein